MNIKGTGDGLAAALVFLGAVLLVAKIAGQTRPAVERYGMIIGLKPEKIAYYRELHAAVWPGVLKMIKECNIRNYSIYLQEVEPGKFYLFLILNTPETISRPTWPGWPPTRRLKSGGRKPIPASTRYRPTSRRNGGAGWRRSFTPTEFR